MPRLLLRAPGHDRLKSLGWLSTAWCEHFVRHGPGSVMGQPVEHGDEYTGFHVDCYAQSEHPSNNHRIYGSGFLSRPKGCDKSGLGARFGLFEAFGPARFGGWARGGEIYEDPWGLGFRYEYAPGEPMGRHVTAPMIRCMATEEEQTGNVFDTIYFNLTEKDVCPLAHVPGINVGQQRVLLPWGGDIRVSTAAAASKDGGKETFVVFDETHLYTTRELRKMYETVVNNLDKRKKIDGTWFLETTTMFAPGEMSVAEATYAEAEALQEGRKKRGSHRLLYDHRWGDCPDLRDEVMLRQAIREAYGEALAWMDEDSLVETFYDLRRSESNNRRFFLNAQTSVQDAWIKAHAWDACRRPDRTLKPGDLVTLGLDGAVTDDATALVACRVSDGHLELLGVWERPEGAEGEGWQVDREAVDAAVNTAMTTYEVAGFYADPPHWSDYVDVWNNLYGEKMRVKAKRERPLEWWTNRPAAMMPALERFLEAVLEKRLSFTPPDDRTGVEQQRAVTLRRHVLNARRRERTGGYLIFKEYPKSPKKIDAAMAAVLAYEARCDAVAAGVKPLQDTFYMPRRLR